MTAPTNTPPAEQRLPFDEAVMVEIRGFFQDIITRYPEVGCLAATVTWNGALNDAAINHGVWVGPDGPVRSPDLVLKSVRQTTRMLGIQTARVDDIARAGEERLVTLVTEIEKRNAQKRALEQAPDGPDPESRQQ